MRADAEAAEHDAATAALRERTLIDTISLAATSSSRLRLIFADQEVHGEVIGVGRDVVSVAVADSRMDVRLASVRVHEPLPGGAPMVGITAASFLGRLRELEAEAATVTIHVRDGHVDRGVLRAVAADHVVIRDADRVAVIPFVAMTHVVTPHR